MVITPQAKRGGIHKLNIIIMKHFSISELFHSDVAVKYGLKNAPKSEDLSKIVESLTTLVGAILDPLRDHLNTPIIITSGYRSEVVNGMVGGSLTSQHIKGEAADFHVKGFTVKQMESVYNYVSKYYEFDQLIFYPKKNIIHVSYKPSHNRRESWVSA